MNIALSTDHAGFEQVKRLSELLRSLGHQVTSFAPATLDPTDDFPDFIRPAAEAVASGRCDRGIIFGGSGQGEAMVANRVQNVRCAVFYGPEVALGPIDAEGNEAEDGYEILRLSREHNDANMLSLGARFLAWPDVEKSIQIWLETPFSGAERHQRRIAKIDKVAAV